MHRRQQHRFRSTCHQQQDRDDALAADLDDALSCDRSDVMVTVALGGDIDRLGVPCAGVREWFPVRFGKLADRTQMAKAGRVAVIEGALIANFAGMFVARLVVEFHLAIGFVILGRADIAWPRRLLGDSLRSEQDRDFVFQGIADAAIGRRQVVGANRRQRSLGNGAYETGNIHLRHPQRRVSPSGAATPRLA